MFSCVFAFFAFSAFSALYHYCDLSCLLFSLVRPRPLSTYPFSPGGGRTRSWVGWVTTESGGFKPCSCGCERIGGWGDPPFSDVSATSSLSGSFAAHRSSPWGAGSSMLARSPAKTGRLSWTACVCPLSDLLWLRLGGMRRYLSLRHVVSEKLAYAWGIAVQYFTGVCAL